MDASRYEIIDQIARGDFAVVYRARDRELGREVAIKQIHKQFLADDRQLARYWQEAQLLASLQHPNILTIYDVVRSKGWLILELMRGNLQPATESDGIDLDYLRTALADCLGALDFLHGNGIVHGDVKPSNMLVDAQGRVKLGDFGLARRASNEEGSLLKGTTKYMAPELVSDKFGAVGPASDLYSLGFSAYELMCGKNFDSLFPGLGSYGRDKQIAWMMWHAAPDRNLPPISRVLEGVPSDLTRVIENLVAKDQSKRCRSAKDALWQLRTDPLQGADRPSQVDAEAEAARLAEAKKKRRMRFAAIGAMALSLALSVFMLLPKQEPKPAPAPPTGPLHATITNVYPEELRLAITETESGEAKEISLTGADRYFINDKSHVLRDLKPQDQALISEVKTDEGRLITEVRVFRPEMVHGLIKSVDADQRRIVVAIDGEADLQVAVPDELSITFNGQPQLDGRAVALADLSPDDRIVVHHVGGESGREAGKISVEREVSVAGVIRSLDAEKGEITISIGDGDKLLTLPFAEKCEITLNDLRFLDDKLLTPTDLKEGDKVDVAHDTRVVRVGAYRQLGGEGVVRAVHYDARTIDVVGEGGKLTTYYIGPKCKITLGDAAAELKDLRKGDTAEVTHDSPGAERPEALTVSARRAADRSRWAILIANENFDSRSITKPEHAGADAKLLGDALAARYKVPAEQVLNLTDVSRVRLSEGIADFLDRLDENDSLLVYVVGRAYKSEDGKVYFAPRDFDLNRKNVTGLSLQWLVDQLEECEAGGKLLLLDCGRAGTGTDLADEPSSAEMIESLTAPPGQAALRTVTAITNSTANQRGAIDNEKGHGLFAFYTAEGYSGEGDKNRDLRIDPTELLDYLKGAITAADQSPRLFLPDNRPPRLDEEAKIDIRRLAVYLGQKRIDLDAARKDYRQATSSAGKELEPRLLFGMILMKHKQRDAAAKHFEELHLQKPNLLLPLEAVAWIRFEQRAYQSGVNELTELVAAIPTLKPGEKIPKETRELFYWIGQLREYAGAVVEDRRRPSAASLTELDEAVAKHGNEARYAYEQGKTKSHFIFEDFNRRLTTAVGDAEIAKLNVERRRLVHYVDFPYEQIVRRILDGLDQ